MLVWSVLLAGPAIACRDGRRPPTPVPTDRQIAFDWSAYRGHCVIAEGYAEGGGGKTFPTLVRGAGTAPHGASRIGIVFAGRPADAAWGVRSGARVQVRGVVSERADLPVFNQDPGEPVMQGMPVPDGTDLAQARRRFVIEGATVIQVRADSQVEADLAVQVGNDVSLEGIVWSLNDRWWFDHDGIDLHVTGIEAIPGWKTMHGRPAILAGHLLRRAMPRIEQRTEMSERDLTEAFVLEVRTMTPHPDLPVSACQR